uniref:Putative secreted peptide n=1 Tax=Anopheles braziliensis TaxID=58242 RepID=A0A2M3ZPL5_9DIPT
MVCGVCCDEKRFLLLLMLMMLASTAGHGVARCIRTGRRRRRLWTAIRWIITSLILVIDTFDFHYHSYTPLSFWCQIFYSNFRVEQLCLNSI